VVLIFFCQCFSGLLFLQFILHSPAAFYFFLLAQKKVTKKRAPSGKMLRHRYSLFKTMAIERVKAARGPHAEGLALRRTVANLPAGRQVQFSAAW